MQETVVATIEHHDIGGAYRTVVDGYRTRVDDITVDGRPGLAGVFILIFVTYDLCHTVSQRESGHVLATSPVDQVCTLRSIGRTKKTCSNRRIVAIERNQLVSRRVAAREDRVAGQHAPRCRAGDAQPVALPPLFHHCTVGRVGNIRVSNFQAVTLGAELPVIIHSGWGPVASRTFGDKVGRSIDGRPPVCPHQLQIAFGIAQPVLFQIASPERARIGVGTEHADKHLVQIGALGIHTDRQAYRSKCTIHRLDFGKNRVQCCRNRRAIRGHGKILAIAHASHAFQQGRVSRPLTIGCRIDIDRIGRDRSGEGRFQEF
ncbi:hypothetical protein D9M71_446230 [compost metagenome]